MRSLLVLFIFAFLLSCSKEGYLTDHNAGIRLSEDTLSFDTVFTSTGSVTHAFLIHNPNDKKIKISSISLAGGNSSAFRINADGVPGPEIRNIDIAANDSIYVFATVTIHPNSETLPFLVRDSVAIHFNGNTRFVQLQAYGRNAVFLRNHRISLSETWNNELPYVILGELNIEEGATLIIGEGTQIYFHADAPMVVQGSLKVNGDRYDSTLVIFQGDRLDEPYRDYPGAWPGIYFSETSRDNVLNYAVIKNSYRGITTENYLPGNTKIILNQCRIENTYDAAILSLGSSMELNNCLIANSGNGIILGYGGNYLFRHVTAVNVANNYIITKNPVLTVANYVVEDNVAYSAPLNASFVNSIFWGQGSAVEDEVKVLKEGSTVYNVHFENCLWKIKNAPGEGNFTGMIAEDPLFDSINISSNYYNFELKDNSPAIDAGKPMVLPIDIRGKTRGSLPDIGAFEKD